MKGQQQQQQQQQQWTVHAEFTISHPGASDPKNPPKATAVQDENGVRMCYSWSAPDSDQQRVPSEERVPYSFQKGSLIFTSAPPQRRALMVPDSGYGSDLLSPNSLNSSLYRQDRKCSSTLEVIEPDVGRTQCGRTQSLRCQTPSTPYSETRSNAFYGCGDPWCHHLHYNDDFSRRISPVRELCEETKADCTCAICDPECRKFMRGLKRDVSVQTYDMVNKCTSPMLKVEEPRRTKCKLKRGKTVEPQRRPSRQSSGSSQTSLPNLSRSPTLQDMPSLSRDKKSPGSDTKQSSDSSKKPKTIHIDVYCTGTDLEADSTSSSSDSDETKSASTPQTVFESKKLSVTHKKADSYLVPYNLRKNFVESKQKSNTTSTSLDKDDSDEESTAYPSKLSSYSNMGYSLSSMSSFPTPYSVSSCTVPESDKDSIANTSWKDTFSDIDSLLPSRSSIQNDSSYFVPKRIEEETESQTGTNSTNLQASDSFEYANSEDRVRIKNMEKLWRNKIQFNQAESRRMLFSQQKQLQEAVNSKLSRIDIDSESDASDTSEKGWTFLKDESARSGSTSRIGESPSTVILRERLSNDPGLGAPFTLSPGNYTEQRYIARRFGPVVNVLRKPGHHVGPVRNPHCQCDHCRTYFEGVGFRNRTSSVGDTSQFTSVNPIRRSTSENRPRRACERAA